MQEREEHDSLERLARMEKNPNAFDSVGPDTPAPTSLADVKLSPEKEAIFKAELQDALQQQRHKRNKKGDTILYNASTKTFLCCYEPCGQRAQRELDRKAEDARRERPLYEYQR